MKHLKNFIYGILLGITNIIPGISGGTMAVVLNIYDDILYAISWKNYRKHLPFLSVLGIGILVGIFGFSHTATFLLENYQMQVYYCFIGLILGSIPLIYKKARHDKVKPRNIVIFILALAFMILLTLLSNDSSIISTLESPDGSTSTIFAGPIILLYLWLFVVSIISTICMILPGISGSLIMLLLGTYTIVIEAVSNLYMPILAPVILGIIIGGIMGVKFIKKLLRFHPQALYFAILGLIIGSLFSIYPGYPGGIQGILCIILMIIFATISYLFSYINKG
ncbi:MAG: DUF368 domain-containing protein [Clostridiales bacterium]|nr:DUF368 domain-containing protein [Clostridiales bacterium]